MQISICIYAICILSILHIYYVYYVLCIYILKYVYICDNIYNT